MIPAVIYAAKSTEDKRGSIPTQLEDCRALASREGWVVVDELQDEGFSAYSGNRGPGLEGAKELAVAAAMEHGKCILVAQHSDRLARGAGDAPDAADHLIEIFYWASRHHVRLWTVEEGELDPIRAFMSGMRNTSQECCHPSRSRSSQAARATGRPGVAGLPREEEGDGRRAGDHDAGGGPEVLAHHGTCLPNDRRGLLAGRDCPHLQR